MSFKGFSTNSSLLKNSISSKKLLQENDNNTDARRTYEQMCFSFTKSID